MVEFGREGKEADEQFQGNVKMVQFSWLRILGKFEPKPLWNSRVSNLEI